MQYKNTKINLYDNIKIYWFLPIIGWILFFKEYMADVKIKGYDVEGSKEKEIYNKFMKKFNLYTLFLGIPISTIVSLTGLNINVLIWKIPYKKADS